MLRPQGFREVYRGTLPSFTRKGLWQRLRYDRRSSRLACAVQWLALSLLSSMQGLLPSDISFQVFIREQEAPPDGA